MSETPNADAIIDKMAALIVDVKASQAKVEDMGVAIEKLTSATTTLLAERAHLIKALENIDQRWLDGGAYKAQGWDLARMMALEARAALRALKPEKQGASDGDEEQTAER